MLQNLSPDILSDELLKISGQKVTSENFEKYTIPIEYKNNVSNILGKMCNFCSLEKNK